MTDQSSSPTETEASRTKVFLLCTGTYPAQEKGKQVVGFHLITNAEKRVYDFTPRYFDAKNVRKAVGTPRAGYVYMVEATDSMAKTIFTGSMRYSAKWPDEKARVEFEAHDDARGRVWAAQKATADAAKLNPLFESLEPVRRAYSRSVGANRVQLLAAAVEYITRGIA